MPDALLLVGDSHTEPNIFYKTHFLAEGLVYLEVDGRGTIVTSSMEKGRAEKQARVDDIRTWDDYNFREIAREVNDRQRAFATVLARAVQDTGADRAVVGISVGRRGIEPSLVSVAVRVGDDFRQDGTMYVPGPDLSYHPYFINHPVYFARNRGNDAPKHVTASMLWSSAGTYYDRAPAFSMLCLDVEGATIAFYTARTLQPSTLVRFDFSPPIRPQRPRLPQPVPQEPAS